MGAWSPDSKTHVAHMERRRLPLQRAVGHHRRRRTTLKVELVGADGTVTVLKESIPVLAGEVVDATFMSAKALDAFLAEQIADAKAKGVLFSIHLKATMMKVSDPIIFGHAVKAYFADVFAKHADTLRAHRRRPPTTASATCSPASPTLPDAEQTAIEADIAGGAWPPVPHARHGRLRPRHHQPARAERRHRRRLDARR